MNLVPADVTLSGTPRAFAADPSTLDAALCTVELFTTLLKAPLIALPIRPPFPPASEIDHLRAGTRNRQLFHHVVFLGLVTFLCQLLEDSIFEPPSLVYCSMFLFMSHHVLGRDAYLRIGYFRTRSAY